MAYEDALLCFSTPHVVALGRLADAVRRRMHGEVAALTADLIGEIANLFSQSAGMLIQEQTK